MLIFHLKPMIIQRKEQHNKEQGLQRVKIKSKYQTIQTIIFFYNLISHLKHQPLHASQLYMLTINQLTIQCNKGAIVTLPIQSFHF